jgi:hypothetical protein
MADIDTRALDRELRKGSAIPAGRAATVDPAVTLRSE